MRSRCSGSAGSERVSDHQAQVFQAGAGAGSPRPPAPRVLDEVEVVEHDHDGVGSCSMPATRRWSPAASLPRPGTSPAIGLPRGRRPPRRAVTKQVQNVRGSLSLGRGRSRRLARVGPDAAQAAVARVLPQPAPALTTVRGRGCRGPGAVEVGAATKLGGTRGRASLAARTVEGRLPSARGTPSLWSQHCHSAPSIPRTDVVTGAARALRPGMLLQHATPKALPARSAADYPNSGEVPGRRRHRGCLW